MCGNHAERTLFALMGNKEGRIVQADGEFVLVRKLQEKYGEEV
ncbi:MAG: hypothetical protein WBG01_08700 [Bacteroidota bacterium]